MAKIVKWTVGEAPTGRYRSFQQRGWPTATYTGTDKIAAQIYCADSYVPQRAKTGSHAVLTVRVADYRTEKWQWRKLKGEFTSLEAAKTALEALITRYPFLRPEEVR